MRIAAIGVLADGRLVYRNVLINVFGLAHGFASILIPNKGDVSKPNRNQRACQNPPAIAGGFYCGYGNP
jgi:hypothetical protein